MLVKLEVHDQRFVCSEAEAGLGASGDGHQNSLVSLIDANASPSFADAVTLLPEANLANSVNLLQLPPVEMWPWICIHSCHFFQDLPPHEELPAWQDTQGWTRRSACLVFSLHLLRFEAS